TYPDLGRCTLPLNVCWSPPAGSGDQDQEQSRKSCVAEAAVQSRASRAGTELRTQTSSAASVSTYSAITSGSVPPLRVALRKAACVAKIDSRSTMLWPWLGT